IGFRDFIDRDAVSLIVCQAFALAAHVLCDHDYHHARRPDHYARMKLNELHIDELRTGLVRQRVSLTCICPTVAGDFVRATDSARGQHHCFGAENFETPSLALVSERAYDTVAVFEQRKNGVLHMHIDSLMNAMIL